MLVLYAYISFIMNPIFYDALICQQPRLSSIVTFGLLSNSLQTAEVSLLSSLVKLNVLNILLCKKIKQDADCLSHSKIHSMNEIMYR